MTSTAIIEVPAHQDILQYTADFIFTKFADQAPDFSNLVILLPHSQVTRQFNQSLSNSLSTELPAIIPPWSGTLKTWVTKFVTNQHPGNPVISEYARQLLFIEALQQYPDLFKEENQWQVTQALLSLFDELSLNQQQLFSSAEEWQQQLQHAYGIEQPHQHLLKESHLVYTLWHAWQQQLSENQLLDETADYISRLRNAAKAITQQQYFICLGLSAYAKAEQAFIQHLVDNNQCQLIEFEEIISDDANNDDNYEQTHHAFSSFICQTFKQPPDSEQALSINQRAQQYQHNYPELTSSELPFSVFLASDEEQQIRAIDYYVRHNLLDGKSNIAIISEDRKLSRRLRALLERANIQLQDNAGWSLATTQAATIIERWLECIEEDFSAYPLLDCLKSPFICMHHLDSEEVTADDFRKNIYRFEHDLIFHENVSSNIQQYKRAMKNRLKRLEHWPKNAYRQLTNILDDVEKTAAPLTALYSANKKISIADFLDALLNSLQQLGVQQFYQDDDAGLVILNTFEELKQSTQYSNPALSWYDCRLWLGMALEAKHFTPPTNNSNVQLMTLEQASHLTFDCVVIAAMDSQHFPGSAKNHPFFNQAVRASLGLDTWQAQRQLRHELFNRSLLSAADILLTACNEDKGEEKPVSPWLELLINFYQLAYKKKPDNPYLQQLVQSDIEAFNCDDRELPAQSAQPSPVIPQALIPEKVSASSYQRMINCPYLYFSADGLRLKPLEELSEELKKSDYGERIHLVLQTFHGGHKKYGNAFSERITHDNRKAAENYLRTLSEKIFFSDLENNVLHRSWLYRWDKHISSYVDWQIQHQADWNIYLSEKTLEIDLQDSTHDAIKVYGRLDRIDSARDNDSHAIIDYKTGRTAKQEDVDSGEDVQLATYALLDMDASEVSYLSVDSSYQKVESKSSLAGDALVNNREANRQRLSELFEQMKKNESLPAWGDDTVCCYCNFSGLCRKQEWAG